MADVAEAVLAGLAGIVGESKCTAEASACESFTVDGQTPDCAVYPGSAEEVAETLKWAAGHDLAVIACGGATKLGIGNPPRKYDIALCTRDLTNVRYYEPSDLTAGVGAGVVLADLQTLLKPDGLWLPLDSSGGGKATLGGIVATNTSGPLRHFYGAPRDMVVGMQIATTEGKLVRTGGRVVKNVAGYDLGKLMIGSCGTLGVITEVNLKLFPLPAERQTFVLPTGTLGVARDLRRRILASPIDLLRMALLDAEAAAIVRPGSQVDVAAREPEIWLEVGGPQSVVDRTRKELEAAGGPVGATVQTCDRVGSGRAWQAISDFSNWIGKMYQGTVVLKGALPIANGEEFLRLAQQEAHGENIKMAGVAMPGVGMLHLGLLDLQNATEAVSLVRRLRKSAEKSGGALTVVSAPAEVKAQVDAWGEPGTGLDLMRKLKTAWDPKGILAPGRFVGSI
ncbi:MAG TPA: FAD-binding oxidoreductase [Terriglobia bacterium]|nr:FAD-binding oxidoreductase [Terriglobia bacterium]